MSLSKAKLESLKDKLERQEAAKDVAPVEDTKVEVKSKKTKKHE